MTTRELEVAIRQHDGVAVIDLHGDVNAAAAEALEEGYERARRAAGERSVVLNFADAEYINSTGIAVIVGLLAQARTQGVQITACGLSEHYREIFEITRLADFMTIADNEDGALSAGEGTHDA